MELRAFFVHSVRSAPELLAVTFQIGYKVFAVGISVLTPRYVLIHHGGH